MRKARGASTGITYINAGGGLPPPVPACPSASLGDAPRGGKCTPTYANGLTPREARARHSHGPAPGPRPLGQMWQPVRASSLPVAPAGAHRGGSATARPEHIPTTAWPMVTGDRGTCVANWTITFLLVSRAQDSILIRQVRSSQSDKPTKPSTADTSPSGHSAPDPTACAALTPRDCRSMYFI